MKKALDRWPENIGLKYEIAILYLQHWHSLPAAALLRDILLTAP